MEQKEANFALDIYQCQQDSNNMEGTERVRGTLHHGDVDQGNATKSGTETLATLLVALGN